MQFDRQQQFDAVMHEYKIKIDWTPSGTYFRDIPYNYRCLSRTSWNPFCRDVIYHLDYHVVDFLPQSFYGRPPSKELMRYVLYERFRKNVQFPNGLGTIVFEYLFNDDVADSSSVCFRFNDGADSLRAQKFS
jgi:hypothetical protein